MLLPAAWTNGSVVDYQQGAVYRHPMRITAISHVWAVALLLSACPTTSNPTISCAVGAESCACTTGGACNAGLSCFSGLCINTAADATGGDTIGRDIPATDAGDAQGTDDGNVVGSPRIAVAVDSADMPQDSTGISSFPPSNQLPVAKAVTITNPGTSALTISSIGWKQGADGGVLQNSFIELDLGNTTLPLSLDPGSAETLQFNVTFTPPTNGAPVDDFSDSVLVVASDAKDQLGQIGLPQFAVTFKITKPGCIPVVNPPTYTFTNATPTTPETQVFSITQSPQASAPCTVSSVALNSPSTIYQLTGQPMAGTTIQPPSDPGYVPAQFTVSYTPTGGNNDPTDNAVIIIVNGQSLMVAL